MTKGVCEETRNRIRVSVAAYAYEIATDPTMSDADFDELCLKINPDESTGRAEEDLFFLLDFAPHTGSWVHRHPDKAGLKMIFEKFYRGEPRDTELDDLI